MSYKIIPTETFKTQVKALQKKYPHIRQDLKDLSKSLKHNPKSGKAFGNGVYKIRLGSSCNHDRDKRLEAENRKIDFGQAHFDTIEVNFKVVTNIHEVLTK